MIILFVTLFSYHEPILCYRVISGYYKSRPSLITYILINFPNMFYIFHVSILDFDVKKNNLLLWFLAIDPTVCFKCFFKYVFVLLWSCDHCKFHYSATGTNCFHSICIVRCEVMNARLMRVLEKTASKGKTFTTKHVTRREVPILVKTSPVEQPNYNIMAVHLHVLSD